MTTGLAPATQSSLIQETVEDQPLADSVPNFRVETSYPIGLYRSFSLWKTEAENCSSAARTRVCVTSVV